MITLDLMATFPKAKALLDGKVVKHVVVERFRDMLPGLKGVLFSIFKTEGRRVLESRLRRRRIARTA